MNVIAIDVGTQSVRCAIVSFENGKGNVLTSQIKPIEMYSPSPLFYEQDSNQIWSQVCQCVKGCLKEANLDHTSISSIAFTATCSLVIVEESNSKYGHDVIMWMDHRAIEEAQMVSSYNPFFLQQFGGTCSPEFSISKLIWLINHQVQRFENIKGFLELPDYLTWRCIKTPLDTFPRSLCSLVCKWGFDPIEKKWPEAFFQNFGLDKFPSLAQKIGVNYINPGTFTGTVCLETAIELGLIEDSSNEVLNQITVSSSMIDAYASLLAMSTLFTNQLGSSYLDEKISLELILFTVAGTSSCHMSLSKSRHFRKGIWGPYFNSLYTDYYVHEAGQSSTGSLIEHIVGTHPEYLKHNTPDSLENTIHTLTQKLVNRKTYKMLKTLHINPCFHGNRSPIADPKFKGAIFGLTLDREPLIDIFQATLEALVYELKFILSKLNPSIKVLILTGGMARNEVYAQMISDINNLEVISMSSGNVDMTLIGAAIAAWHANLRSNNLSLERLQNVIFSFLEIKKYTPDCKYQRYHQLKYKCFEEMIYCGLKIDQMMAKF